MTTNLGLYTFLFLLAITSSEFCHPMYPRLFYTEARQVMIIKFDTSDECPNSYVKIIQNLSSDFSCFVESLPVVPIKNFIHTCQVKINVSFSEFKYTIIGNSKININSVTVHIPNDKENFHMIVTSDWGPLKKKPLISLKQSFGKILKVQENQKKVSGLVLIGDVAYELDTNHGQQYLKFMEELAQVSPYWPIIFITGNHQWKKNSQPMFNVAFQSLGLRNLERVQAYKFWNLKIVTFDPYFIFYNLETRDYEKMKNRIKYEIQSESDDTFMVLISHYPLICSQEKSNCRNSFKYMKDLFDWFSTSRKVDLYLAAHMHQYERIYPYSNKKFVAKQSPYCKGEVPSIVEGVGGNDHSFIDKDWSPQFYSAARTFNLTGYGILQIENINSQPEGNYFHLATKPLLKVTDSIRISTRCKNIR